SLAPSPHRPWHARRAAARRRGFIGRMRRLCDLYGHRSVGGAQGLPPRRGRAVRALPHGAGERRGDSEFGEFLNSSITQFVLGYQWNERFGLQLNIPFIARTFRRLEDGRLERGDSIGAGDLSLIGNLLAFDRVTDRSVFLFSLLGGLKLPSGNPDFLSEELDEVTTAAEGQPARLRMRGVPRHSTPGGDPDGDDGPRQTGGVHGHDLALGSGSVDGVVGGSLYWSFDP